MHKSAQSRRGITISPPNKAILVVDDEPKILEAVTSYFQSRGYAVFAASGGREALSFVKREHITLIVLDLMLPDISGEEVCRIIRKPSRIPIIMLTAKAAEAEQLTGLGLGADDYITKPFSLKILAARIETVLRRTESGLAEDFMKAIERKLGKPIALTASEGKIMSLLIKYPGRIFTREELIQAAFGDDFDSYDRAIDTHIKNIRRKLGDDPHKPVYVQTVHGIGYKFVGESHG